MSKIIVLTAEEILLEHSGALISCDISHEPMFVKSDVLNAIRDAYNEGKNNALDWAAQNASASQTDSGISVVRRKSILSGKSSPELESNNMAKYVTTVEAVQWTGYPESLQEIKNFLQNPCASAKEEGGYLWILDANNDNMCLRQGDWLIENPDGSIVIVNYQDFNKNYRSIELPF